MQQKAISFDVKSQLARLLATENISMQVDPKAITASFDTKNRSLTLPVWQNISEDLYDMLVVHEVGHALDTPADKWVSAMVDISIKYHKVKNDMALMTIKDYLNVIEDARIERRQKIRYPGSKRNFVIGYKELYDRDFFGIKGKNVNTLSFIDRANIYFKNGTAFDIKFSDEEKAFIRKMENTQTFDDVVNLTDEIYGIYASKKMPEKMPITIAKNSSDDDEEMDEESDDSDDLDTDASDENDDSDNSYSIDEESEDEEDNSSSGDEEDNEDLTSSDEKMNNDGEDDSNGDTASTNDEVGGPSDTIIPSRSQTQESAEKAAKTIVENSTMEYIRVDLPTYNLDKIVDDYKKVLVDLRKNGMIIDTTKYQEWRNREKDTISFMVKEFEMRKAADTYARQRISKTGIINTNKLHSYKFNDDIFRRNTVIPAGKNHGFVMFLDWSGSMCSSIHKTMKQLFSLVMFCKRVNVPFDVYIFRTHMQNEPSTGQFNNNTNTCGFQFGGFRLRNILSSRMTMNELNEAFNAFWHISKVNGNCSSDIMNGTPLNQTIMVADKIVNDFRKKYKLQIVNVVFLTDGGSDATWLVDHKGYNKSFWENKNMIIIRDPITNKTYVRNTIKGYSMTSTFLTILKERTNCNLIGFFMTDTLRGYGSMVDPTEICSGRVQDEWKKYKFASVKSSGYDEYFFVNFDDGRKLPTLDIVPTMKKGAISRAFSKFTEKKSINRMMIKTLMDRVAKDSIAA